MNPEELRRQMRAAIDEAQSIVATARTDGRRLTDEEDARVALLTKQVKRDQETLANQAELDGLANSFREPTTTPERPSLGSAVSAIPGGMTLEEQGYRHTGEFLRDVYIAGIPNGQMPDRLRRVQQREMQAAATGAGEVVMSDGGFLVATDRSAMFLQRAYERAVLASRCQEIPIGEGFNGTTINGIDETSRVNGSRYGGVASYWVGEGNTVTASKPRFAQINLKLNKLMALYYATDEVLADSAQLQRVADVVFPDELAFRLDEAIMRGDGAAKPLGFLNAPGTISVAKETNQDAATLVWENIKKMYSRMWSRSRANAVWLINQDIETELYGLAAVVGTGGMPIYLPPSGAAGSPLGTLLGRPVIPIEQASTLGTQGDISLVDLSEYLLARKGDVQSATSIHVQFIYDEQVFRWVLRVDGQPSMKAALTPYSGSSNTLSSFVLLDTRS